MSDELAFKTERATVDTAVARINAKHHELSALGGTMLSEAVELGSMLAEQKRKIGHGGWLAWCEVSLEFSVRQAEKYLTIYEKRDLLQIRSPTSNLSIDQACRLLLRNSAEPPPERVKTFPAVGTDALRNDVLKRCRRLVDHYPATMHREVRRIAAAHFSLFPNNALEVVAVEDATTATESLKSYEIKS